MDPAGQSASSQPRHDTDAYFQGYEDLDVHELMLKDKPRTLAYLKYIEENKTLFQDKVVIDVGSGTGILSLFAARAGAKHVFSIEASGISELAKKIVQENGLSDKITILNCRAEEAKLPDDVKADILMSEWMGFYLLHESMLDSVLHARDHLLKSDGLMVPSSASLWLCPVSLHKFYSDKFRFWDNVYGFDFSPALDHVRQKCLSQPQILALDPDQCLADPELISSLELGYVDADDIAKLTGNFSFKMKRNGVLHGFACWFDVDFDGDSCVTLSTGPGVAETHWKQTCVVLPDPLLVSKEEAVVCQLNLARSAEHPRRYDICIQVDDDVSDEDDEDDNDINVDEPQTTDNIENMLIASMSKHNK